MIKRWWWRIEIIDRRTSMILFSQDGFGRTGVRDDAIQIVVTCRPQQGN